MNGEALDAVRPWIITNEGNIWFTRRRRDGTVYAFVTQSPWRLGERRELTLKSVRATPKTVVRIVGQSDEILEYRPETARGLGEASSSLQGLFFLSFVPI